MKALYVIVAGIMLLCSTVQAQAGKVYTWTDKDGIIHITDQPPPATARAVDVIPYQEQTPAQAEEKAAAHSQQNTPDDYQAVDRRRQDLREQIIRDDLRRDAEAARRRAREAEKRAQEAVERANRISDYTKETIQNLPGPKYQYKALYGHTRQMMQQAEAAQAEAKQAVEEARRAAAEAQAAEEKLQPSPTQAPPTAE
jgi:hypothetical protein